MIDWVGIANRIDSLVHELDVSSHTLAGPAAAIAGPDFRKRLQSGSAAETVERIVSVARLYGVDPSWIITGRMNDDTHRVVLEGSFRDTWFLVQRLLISESAESSARSPEKRLRK